MKEKQKSMLDFWNQIWDQNKGELTYGSKDFFCTNIREFINGNNRALSNLCGYTVYPNLDIELVRECFKMIFAYYNYAYYGQFLHESDSERVRRHYLKDFSVKVQNIFDNELAVETISDKEIDNGLYYLFVEEKRKEHITFENQYLENKKQEWKKRLIKKLSSVEVDLSNNYIKKDLHEIYIDTMIAMKNEKNMKKYYNSFCMSMNVTSQKNILMYLLIGDYYNNYFQDTPNITITDIENAILLGDPEAIEIYRLKMLQNYSYFKEIVRSFNNFYRKKSKLVKPDLVREESGTVQQKKLINPESTEPNQ